MERLNWDKQQKTGIVATALKAGGYVFKHPTLVLEGKDGWFVILTPGRLPHQALVHIDGSNKMDFFVSVPELLE